MKEKIRINGSAVALLRKKHQKLFLQKTLAPALAISVRKLRGIETGNSEQEIGLARRIALNLNCVLGDIVYSEAGPKLVPPPAPPVTIPSANSRFKGQQLYPRFDKENAQLVAGPDDLFESAYRAEAIKVERHVALAPELDAYANELIALAREISRETHPYFFDKENPRGSEIMERMRWLLIWLKGNDVLVYVYDHTKRLPESDEVSADKLMREWQWQAFVAFAPPQEYGETTVEVNVDHGQPYIIDWDAPRGMPKTTPTAF